MISALLAKEAGFDGVDIKACHRYLMNELLASHTREGRYGGSYENRSRLLLTVIREVKKACGDKHLKVIIEACLLTEEEKVRACELSVKAGADFVKTSTGFSTGGAKAEDVALMRKTVGPDMGVKAAGGIRTYEDAMKMIEAGANRLGCSAGIAIVTSAK